MAYDSAEAHEYYEKYKKKGLKKGRKRGRKTTASSKTKKQKQIKLDNVSKGNELEKAKANATKYAKALKATKNNSPVSHGSASTAARTVKQQTVIDAENAAAAEKKAKKLADQKAQIEKQITELRENLKMFSDEEKHKVKTKIQKQIKALRKRLNTYG